MSATRENRNAGLIEDAVQAVGDKIDLTKELLNELRFVLPDDYPSYDVEERLGKLSKHHDKLRRLVE